MADDTRRPQILIGLPVQDQRAMLGHGFRATVTDVERFWADWQQRNGFKAQAPPPDSGLPHGFLIHPAPDAARAYVSDNRWVADCLVCGGGMPCWSENPRTLCFDCGAMHQVVFPDPVSAEEALRVLEVRRPDQRHWDPAFETVEHLVAENIANGDDTGGVEIDQAILDTVVLHTVEAVPGPEPDPVVVLPTPPIELPAEPEPKR
jgi:hypothetical protein